MFLTELYWSLGFYVLGLVTSQNSFRPIPTQFQTHGWKKVPLSESDFYPKQTEASSIV